MQERPDALSVTVDAFHMSHVGWIIDFAAKHRLPTMYIVRDNVAAGGLISYGPSISLTGCSTGRSAGFAPWRILCT